MNLQKYLVIFILIACMCACSDKDHHIKSPDGKLAVNIALRSGTPVYTVHFRDTLLLDTSRLGLVMKDQDYSKNLKMLFVSDDENIRDQFSMHQSKRQKCLYEAVAKTFHFENERGAKIDIIFQVSNDGVAFRYSFPEQGNELKSIESENTSFHFMEKTTAFLQPMSVAKSGWSQVNPCYEEFYEKEIQAGTPSPSTAGWVYPALFHSNKNWILITEAALDKNYCATRLMQNSPNREYTVGFPDPLEKFPGGNVNPQSVLPWLTPWRVITIGSLKTIVESDLGVALANKEVDMDTSFIKPGHSSWSWALLKDDSTVFDVQKKFIDYAADMQWNYCLIDAEWDKRIGYDKIKELSQYASKKNIGLILWYNSAGDWNTTPYSPKDKLLTHEDREKEFSLLNELGIKGIKVDFFGGDGQSMIQYYLDILNDAAKHKLLVNFHGATIPRGWHRTYPNLMSMEAIKGFEYVTFEQKNADEEPVHCSILPFTRNAFDPMDFTPLSLDSVPRINRKTTSGFELALSVVFLSGIQHFVETPSGMQHAPVEVKNFLQSLPEQWHDTKFLSGYPGKDCVVARRNNQTWYIAGINGESKTKTFTLDLSFLQDKSAYLIADTDEKKGVPLKKILVDKVNASTQVSVSANGGFVMVVK